MKIQVYNSFDTVSTLEKKEIVDFLFEHLDQFGDKWDHILRAVDYALNPNPAFGGFVLYTRDNGEIKGAVVVNKTRMKGYIPENVLVYIAVHKDQRGKGIGKKLMNEAINMAKGDVALHVEHDNPARFLYEKVGFKNPYLEMRYYKNSR
jgi:ribosomal protein S18 acetylase RimI-like enzyme